MKFSDLKFVRLTQPEQFSLVPRYLFEQVKGATFKIDRLYQFGPILLASPLTFFYVLAEREQLEKGRAPVKGILWAEINPLDDQIKVHAFSIDKEYQQNMNGDFQYSSEALKATLEFLRGIQKEQGLSEKIEIVTLRHRAYEKAGWRKSKKILMEI